MLRRESGFTLVEVMLVVAIIALLAMLAIPNTARARLNAEDAKTQKELQSLFAAITTFEAVNNRKPITWAELEPYITIDESKYELNAN